MNTQQMNERVCKLSNLRIIMKNKRMNVEYLHKQIIGQNTLIGLHPFNTSRMERFDRLVSRQLQITGPENAKLPLYNSVFGFL